MKITYISGLLLVLTVLLSCKKEEEAPTDNKATISFWQDFETSQNLLMGNDFGNIKVYIDGILAGTYLINNYAAIEPPCGNGQFVHIVELGSAQSKSVQFDLRYADNQSNNYIVFQNGIIEVSAGGCFSKKVEY